MFSSKNNLHTFLLIILISFIAPATSNFPLTCSFEGERFPSGSCNQYLECKDIKYYGARLSYSKILKICPPDTNYDRISGTCRDLGELDDDCNPIITNDVKIIPPKNENPPSEENVEQLIKSIFSKDDTFPIGSACRFEGDRLPARSCNQYFQCEGVWYSGSRIGYNQILTTCPDDTNFDRGSGNCSHLLVLDNEYCMPATYSMNDDEKLSKTFGYEDDDKFSLASGYTPSVCRFETDRLPAKSCNQYFECEAIGYFGSKIDYNKILKTCPDQTKFDRVTGTCRPLLELDEDCMSRTTKSMKSSSSRTSSRRKSSVFSEYNENSSSSEDEQFSLASGYSPSAMSLNTKSRKKTSSKKRTRGNSEYDENLSETFSSEEDKFHRKTECRFENDRFPAKSCNQYFECEAIRSSAYNGGFKKNLKTCPRNTNFDSTAGSCKYLLELDDDCMPINRKKTRKRKTSRRKIQKQHYEKLSNTISSEDDEFLEATGDSVCRFDGDRLPSRACNQYFECKSIWVSGYNVGFNQFLKTCPYHKNFDRISRTCKSSLEFDDNCMPKNPKKMKSLPTGNRHPTTTENYDKLSKPVSSKKACRFHGQRLPARACNQYFECEVVWSSGQKIGYNQLLKICPNHKNFDRTAGFCRHSLELDDHCMPKNPKKMKSLPTGNTNPGTTEYYDTSASGDSGTTENYDKSSASVKSACRFHGDRLPARVCNQYFECDAIWSSGHKTGYNQLLKICPKHKKFDRTSRTCKHLLELDDNCMPKNPKNMKNLPTGNRHPTTTENYDKLSKPLASACRYDGDRLPARTCNQYFECKTVWNSGYNVGFNQFLKSCPHHTNFDRISGSCTDLLELDDNCMPKNPKNMNSLSTGNRNAATTGNYDKLSKPDSSEDDKLSYSECRFDGDRLPSKPCDRYFECEAVWSSGKKIGYNKFLKTCQYHTKFDRTSGSCKYLLQLDDDCMPINTKTMKRRSSRRKTSAFTEYEENSSSSKNDEFSLESDYPPSACRFDRHRLPVKSCNQYYECEAVWSGSKMGYNKLLKTCPYDSNFDRIAHNCRPPGEFDNDCMPITINGMKIIPSTRRNSFYTEYNEQFSKYETFSLTSAVCRFERDRLPAKSCDQYLECEAVWESEIKIGYNQMVKTCPQHTKFDRSTGTCRALLELDDDCLPINSKTMEGTSSRRRTSVTRGYDEIFSNMMFSRDDKFSSLELVCRFENDRLPARSCKQYYECESVWSFGFKKGYNKILKTCPYDTSFDRTSGSCRDSLELDDDCMPTTSMERLRRRYPENVEMLLKNIFSLFPLESACRFDNDRLPAKQCNQYYECVSAWVSGFKIGYNQVLETCPHEATYDRIHGNCSKSLALDDDCMPITRAKVPGVCTKSDKFPASSCDQYYECVKKGNLGWTPVLKTCNYTLLFHPKNKKCVDWSLVDCDLADFYNITGVASSKATPASINQTPTTRQEGRNSASSKGRNITTTVTIGLNVSNNDNQKVGVRLVPVHTTTTTVLPPRKDHFAVNTSIPEPSAKQCTEQLDRFPDPKPNYYWECYEGFGEYHLFLKFCPTGQIFNNKTKNCNRP